VKKRLTAPDLESRANKVGPTTKRENIFDTASDAVVRIGPRGLTWWVIYRVRGGDGKPKWYKFAEFHEKTLAEARLEAGRLKELARKGIDPAVQDRQRIAAEIEAAAVKQRAEQLRQSSSFAVTVEDYLAANADRDKDGLANTKRNLKHATDAIGSVPLADVTRDMITPILAKRTSDGKYAANATFVDLRALLNWSVGQGRIAKSPMAGIEKPHKTKPRKIFLDPDELKVVWISSLDEPFPFGAWVRMIIATGGQRRQDVSGMRWKDIGPLVLKERNPATQKLVEVKFAHIWRGFDPSKPQEDQREHRVPLNALAQSILKDVPRIPARRVRVFWNRWRAPDQRFLKGDDPSAGARED
jgi:integrase